MSDGIAQDQLQSFVRRIESVEDELKALNGDKSEIYKEARGVGFDVKVLRKVVAARRMDAAERANQGEIFELYWDAVHGVSQRVRAHVENIEEFPVEHDADGVFPDNEPQSAPRAASDLTTPPALAGQVAPIQPETANEAAGIRPVPSMSEQAAPAPVQRSDASNSAEPSGVTVVGTESGTVTLSFADKIKKLRPLCQQPSACRSSGGKAHCYICTKTTEQAGAA